MKIRDNGRPIDTAAVLIVKDDLYDIRFQRNLIRRFTLYLGRLGPGCSPTVKKQKEGIMKSLERKFIKQETPQL